MANGSSDRNAVRIWSSVSLSNCGRRGFESSRPAIEAACCCIQTAVAAEAGDERFAQCRAVESLRPQRAHDLIPILAAESHVESGKRAIRIVDCPLLVALRLVGHDSVAVLSHRRLRHVDPLAERSI